jgi:hypothetical protein
MTDVGPDRQPTRAAVAAWPAIVGRSLMLRLPIRTGHRKRPAHAGTSGVLPAEPAACMRSRYSAKRMSCPCGAGPRARARRRARRPGAPAPGSRVLRRQGRGLALDEPRPGSPSAPPVSRGANGTRAACRGWPGRQPAPRRRHRPWRRSHRPTGWGGVPGRGARHPRAWSEVVTDVAVSYLRWVEWAAVNRAAPAGRWRSGAAGPARPRPSGRPARSAASHRRGRNTRPSRRRCRPAASRRSRRRSPRRPG